MDTPPPAIAKLMALAAEHRAAGASWEAVGRAVRRRAEVCRRWTKRYPAFWNRLLADAARQHRHGAANEAVTTLRNLLRSDDERIKRDSAKALIAAEPEAPQAALSIDPDDYVEQLDARDRAQLNDALDAAAPADE